MTFATPQAPSNDAVPFSVGAAVAWAFRIFGRAWGRLLVLLLLQIVLTAIVGFAVDLLLGLFHLGSTVLVKLVNYLVEQVSVAYVTGAIVTVAFAAARERPCGLGEAFAASGRRFAPMLGLCVLQAIAVGIGFLLLIVPGLIVAVLLSVAVPACMLEGLGPIQSCSRSFELTRGRRWAIFGVMVLGMIAAVVATGATLPVFFHHDALTIALAILGVLGVLALIVLSTTLSTAIYVALRPADGRLDDPDHGRLPGGVS